MTKHRSLTEGLKATPPVARDVARDFIFGDKKPAAQPVPVAQETARPAAPLLSRSPISTRIRTDLAEALKRASLERQLSKQEPNTLQDILEQAIEPWLRSNGYIV